MRNAVALFLTLSLALPAAAAVHEARIPLHDGQLRSLDLSRALLTQCHIKGVEINAGSIDLRGVAGSLFVHSLNAALGDGCNISLQDDSLLLRVDPDKLPKNVDALKKATRVFTADIAPDATAAQRHNYGLWMPRQVDPNRTMVVLIHGLDCNRSNWFPMAELLAGEGYQVAYFTYPSDGPLEDSAALLAQNMLALRETFPDVNVDILAHSMGGLVARRYVESDDYAGGVKHLVLLGTPNLGSRWATYRWALEVQEHYQLWRHDPDWRPTWIITDGLGEAGRDLKPTSRFLAELNIRPRRAGVQYTLIAGAQHPVYPITAHAIDGAANIIPDRAAHWWGFRQTESALHHAADRMRSHIGKTDGPVNLKSTQLPGVDDYVVLPADHNALYYPEYGKEPAAWAVIRDRLSN